MKSKKNYEVADILELIKISNEFIERNRRVYERLAAGIPTQSILDALVPELVDLYGDYIIQINQYESGESYITLAILVSNDYDISAHKLILQPGSGCWKNITISTGTLPCRSWNINTVS